VKRIAKDITIDIRGEIIKSDIEIDNYVNALIKVFYTKRGLNERDVESILKTGQKTRLIFLRIILGESDIQNGEDIMNKIKQVRLYRNRVAHDTIDLIINDTEESLPTLEFNDDKGNRMDTSLDIINEVKENKIFLFLNFREILKRVKK